MSNEFYVEACALFKIYNVLHLECPDISLKTPSTEILLDIAYTFFRNLDFDSLCNIYPMQLECHLHFFIINKMNQDKEYAEVLDKLFRKSFIAKNEWLPSKWEEISSLKKFCLNKGNFPDLLNNRKPLKYLLDAQKETKYSSNFQQYWLSCLLKEMKL